MTSMSEDRDQLAAEAQAELAAGHWPSAASAFARILEDREDPDARFGLGIASFWLGEAVTAIGHWERAYVGYRRDGRSDQAVFAAFYLCVASLMSLGSLARARGWINRADRLVRDHGLTGVAGWVTLGQAHLAIDAGRPADGERLAREALEGARATGDVDLELCLVSEIGLALVDQGRTDEGVGLLDEAMVAALAGEGRDPDAIVLISCRSITATSRGGDVSRALQWIRAADAFYERHGSPHLYTTCRTEYGGLLLATGDWGRAEEELAIAIRVAGSGEPAVHAQAVARLAELRLAQGRVDEAARLLDGLADHPAVARVAAMLHLARGDAGAAASVVRRRLRGIDDHGLEAAGLHEIVAEADIARGVPAEALARARRLIDDGTGVGNELIVARGQRAHGRAALALDDQGTAIEGLERAVATFDRLGLPYEAATSRLWLARAAAAHDRGIAIAEARLAFDAFERLGAARDADAASALLRALGARLGARGPRAVGTLTRREVEVLGLLGEGLSNGEIGDRLFVTRRTVEHHVASILAKLGLSGRTEAAAYAVRHLDHEDAEPASLRPAEAAGRARSNR
jgi:ATP/maltotriose-dependent transcriptional regulator MalT